MRPDHLKGLERPRQDAPGAGAPGQAPDYADPQDRSAMRLSAIDVRAAAGVLRQRARAVREQAAVARQHAQRLLWQDRDDTGAQVVDLGEVRQRTKGLT